MSEFSAKDDDKLAAPAVTANPDVTFMNRLSKPIVLGLSAPWLAGCVLLVCAAGWYLFAPDGQPSTNELAFGTGAMEPVREEPALQGHMEFPAPPSTPLVDVRALDEALSQVKDYGEANRTAIKLLSDTVRAQAASIGVLQQQLSELQAQSALASVRPSLVEKKTPVAKRSSAAQSSGSKSAVAGMRLSAVQTGMAWIYWGDRTWAVQVGDPVGDSGSSVIVTSIDARARLVHTSAGTIR